MDRVIFRKLGGEVIALLPDNEALPGCVDSYMHTGQHGAADWLITRHTEPATEEEYKPLLHELIQVGYEPRVMHRLMRPFAGWAT